jgi:hypothetical protein
MVMALIGAHLFSAAPLLATTYTWDLSNPSGVLDISQDYDSSPSGVTITAYGFDDAGDSIALYGKSEGPGEMGLGLDGNATGNPTNEIVTNDAGTFYVQLDLTNLLAAGATTATVGIQSVQDTESYQLWASGALGELDSALSGPSVCTGAICTVFIPLDPNNPYLALTAPSGDVLLGSLSATTAVPEPSTWLLLSGGLAGLAAWRRPRPYNAELSSLQVS